MQLEHLRGLIEVYTYFILFPLIVFEGPIVTIIAGFLVHLGVLNLFITYVVVVAGDVTGDVMWYGLGRFARGFVGRMGYLFGISHEKFRTLDKHFEVHSKKTIFIGKLVYGAEVPVLVAAGIAKLPFREFFVYTLLPTLPKSLFFLAVGYYFGGAFETINKFLNNAALSGMIIFVLVVVFYFVIYKYLQARISQTIGQNT